MDERLLHAVRAKARSVKGRVIAGFDAMTAATDGFVRRLFKYLPPNVEPIFNPAG